VSKGTKIVRTALELRSNGILGWRTKCKFDFFQGSTFCFHNITSYVQDSNQTHCSEAQVYSADSKLVYYTQEIQPDHKVGDLVTINKNEELVQNINETNACYKSSQTAPRNLIAVVFGHMIIWYR